MQSSIDARWATYDAQYAKYRLLEVARRMRLSIVEGNPSLNLALIHSHHYAQPFEQGRKETRVLLRGAPNGRSTELVYQHRTGLDNSFFAPSDACIETLDARLTIWVARPFAPFEVVLRSPGFMMASPPVMSLPPISLGDPLLDMKFVLSTLDPSLAPIVAPALTLLVALGFLHIRASEQSISYVMTIHGAPYGFCSIEQVQYALEQIAAALEKRHLTTATSTT